MQENEFEKQVQQKMDELKLHPSDAVWQKIEARIKKEKRRRWILIFFPAMLICFLYGGYVLLNRSNSTHEYQHQLTKNFIEKNNINEKTKNRFDLIKNNQTLTENKKPFAKPATAKGNRDQKIKTRDKLKSVSDYELTKSLVKDISANKKEFDTKQNIVENGRLINTNIKTPEQEKILPAKQSRFDSTTIHENELSDQAQVDLITDNKEKKNENVISTDNKNITTAKNKHSWNWGFSFSGGISGMANSFLGSGQQSFASVSMSSGSQGTNPYSTPSLIKSSIAFVTGFYAEKNILQKIIFTTGLNYKLFSTTNTIGADSANYFRANSTVSTYHNFYHYIGLPIEFKFQIANSKKTQLYWNIGFSISQLISSNALQFNNSSGLYYHDNSQFNKTQIGFNTGLDIALFSKQKKSLLIGPYLNYNISKIAPQGYNKHHFTFIGLRAQFIFRKK